LFFFYRPPHPRHLHSFPTRRSSDLSEGTADALRKLIADRHADALFSVDGSSIEEQVAKLLEGKTLAVGESCTGGLLSTRLTDRPDRKSTRLNSSHRTISYAVFCLKK